MPNRTVEYFEAQFRRQVASAPSGDPALDAFQQAALPYLSGRVLDLACGLGGLSVAAARKGCSVVAVDASPTAVGHVAALARAEGLDVTALRHDAATFDLGGPFDAVVAIGIDGDHHHLFTVDELDRAFAGWAIESSRGGEFPAARTGP